MAAKFITQDLGQVLALKSLPGIVTWNRLEGRPRTEQFDRALRAEVRDSLWMLTRQWQLGEFRGDDAGSPIFTKVQLETTRLSKYRAVHGETEEFPETIPLEAKVEKMPIPFTQAGLEVGLDLRLLLGRQWLKMVRGLPPACVPEFIARYPVHVPDPTSPADFPICAHVEAWSDFAASAGCLDGAKLYEHLTALPGNHASEGIAALTGMDAVVDPIAARFVRWFEKLFYQPKQREAWQPEHLEYQFAVSAPDAAGERVLVAEQYFHGHLDWYNFDIDAKESTLGEPPPPVETPDPAVRTTLTMLPTQVTFNGMPNTRWWRFEDGRTNFGDVKPDTTDLGKLLLIEFALVYANDWFLIPFGVPAGTIASVRGMAVTNVFGERVWVEAAGRGKDEDWQRWAMFGVSIAGKDAVQADTSLVIAPAAQNVLEGRPLEEVLLARDEMANMVWAVERGIALPTGAPKPGREAAAELRSFFELDLARRLGAPPLPPPPAAGAKIRYEVMSSVPENWIPLVPVHVDGSNREIQLQRGAMLRVMTGDTAVPVPVRPRTSLLRAGLEQSPPQKYLLHEEEVSRAGTRVTQGFQRTRWRDGRAWVWLGVRKRTGRGEGSSGLAFDRIVDIPPPPAP